MARHAIRVTSPKRFPEDFAAVCGLYWEGSAWYEALHATCATQDDAALGKTCPIFICAKDHHVDQCGLCPEFPCILLVHFAARSGSDDLRIFSAARRAELGDQIWSEWARTEKMWVNSYCPLRTLQVQHQ